MAIGATPRSVLELVVRQGVLLTIGGIALGCAGAALGSRMLDRFLYGVAGTDLFTFVGVSALVAVVGIVAAVLPARRATRIDPVLALRREG
jgi:ABC-type antimicrobial peptide transport system permease subunit